MMEDPYNSTMAMTINDETTAVMSSSSSNNNSNTDTSGGHFVAGCTLLAFGGFFLGLTAFRLNRIAAALAFLERSETQPRTNGVQHQHNPDDAPECDDDDPSDHVTLWARTYCRQHIPEYDTRVLYRTSLALLLSTVCGLVFHFGIT